MENINKQILIARKLTEDDWDTLQDWWTAWPNWPTIPKSFLPNNGTGGLMVEKDGSPIVDGFIYLTNSKGALLEWMVSNPDYREKDRDSAIETLITKSEEVVKSLGYEFVFTITQHQKLINTHKKLGWTVDTTPSYELTKTL